MDRDGLQQPAQTAALLHEDGNTSEALRQKKE